MMDLNESPVLMLLDPSPPAQSRDLPVRLFESGALLPLRPRPVAMSDTTSFHTVLYAQRRILLPTAVLLTCL